MARITRRDALTGAAAGLTIVKPQTAFTYQANSAVAFGIIGTGGRGRYDGNHMVNDGRTRLAAICDAYPDRIDLAKTQIPTGDKAASFKDFNQLLKHPGIDAVLIATPVHLHPVHFEAAVQAKKHIYCEKPAGADVAGVKRLLRASQKADKSKTIQFGFQQRFSPEYLKAFEYLKSGKLGQVKMMQAFWVLGNTPPKGFRSPYPPEDQKIRHWGAWMETSGGAIVEQDCHGVDVLNWFAQAHPVKAYGTGGLRYPIAYGDWDSDHHNITYYYPGGIEGWLISIKHTAGYRDVKEQIFGSNHMVEVARTYYKLHGMIPSAPLKNADNLSDRSMMEKAESKREITIDAIQAFFSSIINKKPYNMAQEAADATFTSILGRMAYQKKREVTWDEMIKSA